MKIVEAVADLRETVSSWRSSGEVIAFAPTMGNLHQGHVALMDHAATLADRVVASIFVNPLQFGANEDLDAYPRTFAADCEKLEQAGVDLLFYPSVSEMYPRPSEEQTKVEVPFLSSLHCGESRPGHFVGVATVVCKLFNMVQPDHAVFGKKDFQQLMVIRRMVEDLALPVQVHGLDTVRETDGLALSSRNGYLSAEERAIAPALYQTLGWMNQQLQQGRRDFASVEAEAKAQLLSAGLKPDYLNIVRSSDLVPPDESDRDLVILAAAYLGKARLIDNLEVPL